MFTFAAMSAVMSATLACACRQKSSSEPSELLHALHSALRSLVGASESFGFFLNFIDAIFSLILSPFSSCSIFAPRPSIFLR